MENRTVSELIKKFENHCAANRPKPNPGTDCCSKEKFLASSAQIQKYYENRIKLNTAVIWGQSNTSLDRELNEQWEQDDDVYDDDDDDQQNEDDLHSNASHSSFDVFFSATSLAMGLNAAEAETKTNIVYVPPLQLEDDGDISQSDEFAAESITTLYSFASDECDQCAQAADVRALLRDECAQNKQFVRKENAKNVCLSHIDMPITDVDELFNTYCNFAVGADIELKFAEMFRDAFRDNQEEINDAVRLFAKLMP